jgi:hypothetical protein
MTAVFFWRRTDLDGLERLELSIGPDGIVATGHVLSVEDGGFSLVHRWDVDPAWRARSVTVERTNAEGRRVLTVERDGDGWRVDGAPRPDLDGVDEPDLSVTPFCNSLPLRRLPQADAASLTLDTAFIDGAALTVARSRQRYHRKGPRRARYVDLGLSRGFEADLDLDADGLVLRYEHLFERVAPGT